VALSTLSDAASAVQRLRDVLLTDTISKSQPSCDENKRKENEGVSVRVTTGEFAWTASETGSRSDSAKSTSKSQWKNRFNKLKVKLGTKQSTVSNGAQISGPTSEKVVPPPRAGFTLSDVNLQIANGSLVVVVGPVGSGKSSLLQALIGGLSDKFIE
jgi:ABC-type multidrug transport system fused ATPase/permease subunit